jgi:hypothetical protein
MKDLFGVEVPDVDPKALRRADMRHPDQPGTGPKGQTCGTCGHRVLIHYHNRAYNKCAVLRDQWTHGPGTDLRRKDEACSRFVPGVGASETT